MTSESIRKRVAVGILLLITPLSLAHANPPSGPRISPNELLAMIEAGTAPTIVDVRTRAEYEAGHVPGALHIPFWATLARSSQIPTPKQEPIVIYCEHGPRAGAAKAAYRISGFERVIYLRGHMTAWKKAGLAQESGSPGALQLDGDSGEAVSTQANDGGQATLWNFGTYDPWADE